MSRTTGVVRGDAAVINPKVVRAAVANVNDERA